MGLGQRYPAASKTPRRLAKINAEAEFEMFIFQLRAIHPVTPLRSSEPPPVYIG